MSHRSTFVSHACDGSGLEESGRGSKRGVCGRFRRVRMYLLAVLALVGVTAGCFFATLMQGSEGCDAFLRSSSR
jgi:hypothetical protein